MFPGLFQLQAAKMRRSTRVSTTTEDELFQITDARSSQLLCLACSTNTINGAFLPDRQYSFVIFHEEIPLRNYVSGRYVLN
jgi:hypothetical protein